MSEPEKPQVQIKADEKELLGQYSNLAMIHHNPEEFTMLELADLVKELTDSKSKIVYRPLPIDDPKRRLPDITRAKNLLDWEPQIDLRTGLEQTIAWFSVQAATTTVAD